VKSFKFGIFAFNRSPLFVFFLKLGQSLCVLLTQELMAVCSFSILDKILKPSVSLIDWSLHRW
ncbi:hypothetical protein, partial [Tepidanaerobacter acetatoxydans]|uniref:hypothetical protein n=1 Tax=Tepidanaerobacter acetatoxydans TaxID=499229 RepID=UPI001BD51292